MGRRANVRLCEDCGKAVERRKHPGRRMLCIDCATEATATWNRAQSSVAQQYREARRMAFMEEVEGTVTS